MKNILLLTDFSDNANNAIHYAMQLFAEDSCNFYLMHVHKISSFTSDDLMRSPKNSIYQSITQEPKKKLNTIAEALKNTYHNANHSFNIHVDFDVFIDAIKQTVKNKNIDFIVMGTNGITGAKEVFLGSNTIHVIRHVNCKTLIIPEAYQFKPIKEILLPLTPKNHIENKPFTELLEFMETYLLHLHVLRINPNNKDNEFQLKDKSILSIIDCKYHNVNNVPINFAIASYLQTNTVDFISLFAEKEGFLDRIFSKSETRIDTSKINKPILVLHH